VSGRPLVSVVLVNWNTERFLAACLDSIAEQDYSPLEVILVNNGSPGFVAADWRSRRIDKLIENAENEGFAAANNRGIAASHGEYVTLLNCDAYLAPGAISAAVAVMESAPDIGQVAFKVMHAVYRDRIDTAGHLFRPDRTAAHRGSGEADGGRFAEAVDLFGASACACLYRRAMLDEISFKGEVFDHDFGSYYEDVDLDWRARIAGWRCRFAPDAVAYHHGHGSGARTGRAVRIEAEKNRYLMMLKCDTAPERARHIFQIAAYECWHALSVLRRPYLLLAIPKYFAARRGALVRRGHVESTRKAALAGGKQQQVIFTPRFGLRPRELTKPPPSPEDFYLALTLPPLRTPPPLFSQFLDAGVRTERYLASPWSGRRPPRVSVLVLNYNGLEMTRECLRGLAEQTYPDFEVVLLDNGSVDDELSALEKEFPRVRGIRLAENAGFAGGINRAFDAAQGELVAMINNDAVPEPGWLSALVARMEETGAAAVSGLMEEEYRAPSPNHALNLLGRIVPGAFGSEARSFYPSGGNCLLDKEAVEAVRESLPWRLGAGGGSVLSDFYLLYSEDVSLGWRLRMAGRAVERAVDARAAHRVSATVLTLPKGLVTYLRHRNRVLNLLLFPERATVVKMLPLLALDWLLLHLAGLVYWQLGEPMLAVDWFFLTNIRAVARQRRIFQRARKTTDREILPWLSSGLLRREYGPAASLANALGRAYARLMRLPLWECRAPIDKRVI
jgi:GT2 family glycosyltransferase